MANTREKVKEKNKTGKLSTGKKKMTPETLKLLSPDDKMQYLLEHGHMIKDKLFNEVGMKSGRLRKSALAIGPENLMSKNGKLRKRNRHNLKYLDHILMNELKIKRVQNKPDQVSKIKTRVNNNDTEISDQNNTVNDATEYTKETEIFDNIINSEQSNITESDKISNKNTETLTPEKEITKSRRGAQNKEKSRGKKKETDKNTLKKRLTKLDKVKLSSGVVLSLGQFECDYCHKTFNSKSSLRRHIYMHLDIKPFQCKHCPMKFGQCCNWRSHMKNVHPTASAQEKYICHKCKKTFLLKENLSLHLAAHMKKENSYKCVFCDKAFSSHLLLAQHEKQHMNPRRYKCSICTMCYDSRTRFSLHIKSHLAVKDLSCQYCGKEFLRPSSVKRHVQIFHRGIRVECPVCKKMLKGHLTEHMRTHENERPHECPDCGQKFTQSTQLNVHKRSHTGARPYPCRICKRPFTHSNALMLHIRRHTGEKPFQCAMCRMSFSQLPHMKSHMRNIHKKEKFYKCPKCSTFFKLKAELEKHEGNCTASEKEMTFDTQARPAGSSVCDMSISKMRFLLALLFTMIASKEKLKYLGFNKRLIDDILVESVEAMGQKPCKDESQPPLLRLRTNIAMLLRGTVPKDQLLKFEQSKKTTEELLELLTDDKK